MPKEVYGKRFPFLPRSEILSFEEISRFARLAVGLGVHKLRLTGGEPLLRSKLHVLVAQLARLETDLALTTNGSLLAKHAVPLRDAGLQRVTVSLDSLDDAVFQAMNDVNFPVSAVLQGIDAAAAAGLEVKINCVVRKGVNDHGVTELARHFRGSGHILRFIEFMDVGITNGWRLDQVLSGAAIIERIKREVALEPASPRYPGEVAKRWAYADGSGEIGIVTSVTQPFCGECSRARLSASGKLYTCLFTNQAIDLRDMLRGGSSDDQLTDALATTWRAREDRYSEQRTGNTRHLPRVEMSYIGG